ncbi:F-box protein At2g23160-like [Papaver somniferum]|uniref:F-box protein At2g23160-like n=1 Tax=Papaver somniferum TaxID=3469 RepID=UPI000E6FC80E|nr:F-box protein At2g23160-like [Papaver somniferum]
MEYFNCVPEEITLDIISRVPAESIFECKSVCTAWRNLIFHHPSFSKMHFQHHLNHPAAADSGTLGFIALTLDETFQYFVYNENHESVESIRRLNVNLPFGGHTRILGSSNSLICLSRRLKEEKTYICNPITREYVMLPEIVKRFGTSRGAKGFGYVSSTNEYKVVTVMFEYWGFVEAYIYTLGSGNGWRNLGKFKFGSEAHLWEQGIFLNGAIYWWDKLLKMIVTFDLAEEKFCEHLSPPASFDSGNDDFRNYCRLWVLDGCLCFAGSLVVHGNCRRICWNAWLLRKKDDQSLGWSKVFRIYNHDFFAVTKSYSVLTYIHNSITIHDPETSTTKYILVFEECFDEVFPHKNTLVSLKKLGKEDTKIMESVKIPETESDDQPFN